MDNFLSRSSPRGSKATVGDITKSFDGFGFPQHANNENNEDLFSFEPPSPVRSSPKRFHLDEIIPRINRTNGSPDAKMTSPSPPRSLAPPRPEVPSSPDSFKTLNSEFHRKANSPKVKRLVTLAQMYFLDYYCDMFDYVIARRQRALQTEQNLHMIPPQERAIQWRNYVGKERSLLRKRRIKPKHKDFSMITQVGQGGYGQVYLARKRDTQEICALKILSKRLLLKLNEARHVLTERDILTNTRSEWLVKLLYAFQDDDKLYLAMEFVPGGDYRTLLNNVGYLIPPHARFYISEMFAAVNSLHELGYTHRDLKPENFLIDSKGHIKLTDFGLAAGSVSTERIESMRLKLNQVKDLEYKPRERTVTERQQLYRSMRVKNVHIADSIVGSPDYMALEVLEGRPYDFTIDYWSLGCMLYETLVGFTPFSGGSSDETYNNLRNWSKYLKRPKADDGRYMFSDRTWHLISKLISHPQDRVRSFRQIMSMPYFVEVEWMSLRNKVPPFTPQLDDEEDAGYFDDFNDEDDMAKYKDVMAKREQIEKMSDRSSRGDINKNFVGFTFKHKSSLASESTPTRKHGDRLLLSSGRTLTGRRDDPFGTLY